MYESTVMTARALAMRARFWNSGGAAASAIPTTHRPDSTIPRYAATASGVMGRYNATLSPRSRPSSSSPLATRALSRFSSPYVIFRTESDPSSPTRIEGLLQNSTWLLSEDDPEFADHGRPEFFPTIYGPPLKILERPEPAGRHQFPDVRCPHTRFGRHPGGTGAISHVAALICKPVQGEMGCESPTRLRVRQEYRAELEPEPFLFARIERSRVTLRCRLDSSRECIRGLPRHAPRFNVGGPDGRPHGG